jgi:hypothetical protein
MENFNLYRLKDLSPNDSKAYITKYFVPLSNGTHAFYMDGMYVVKEEQEIKRTYFNRMSKELCNYYFKEFSDIKSIIYDVNQDTFFEDKLNLCPRLKFKPSIFTYSDKTNKQIDFIKNFLKEILCSNKQDSYDFLLKWLSNMVKGNKNTSCLYLKGVQGTGKSSLFYFLSNHVLGKNLCLETGSDPIRTKFNEILGGKLLVNIEELENFSRNEWESISSTLKRMITSNSITLQNKCTKAYETTNINNYILCSNNDAIKDDDGRRYFILDISTKKKDNHDYYNSLYKCMNDEVGEAFYNYLLTIDTENFNPQSFPMTNNKLDSLSKRLDNVYKFVKEEYILNNYKLDISLTEMYSYYKIYCRNNLIKPVPKEDFNRKLSEANINKIRKNNKYYFDIQLIDLVSIAKKNNWINDLDEFDEKNIKEKPRKNMLDSDSEDEIEVESVKTTKYNSSSELDIDFSD